MKTYQLLGSVLGVLMIFSLTACGGGGGSGSSSGGSGTTLESYVTPGTYQFTVPTGVTSIVVAVWGGGGGGGLGCYFTDGYGGGGGGGGGGYAQIQLSVTPGTTFAVAVGGSGGPGSTPPPGDCTGGGAQGGTSQFQVPDGPVLVAATGGYGGGNLSNGGGGGSGSGETGFTGTAGERGQNGTPFTNTFTQVGGNGGAGANGGAGGVGASAASNVPGTNGVSPGGGGGGGGANASDYPAGQGAAGQVIITAGTGGGSPSSGGGAPLTITTASLPNGTVGVAYSVTLQAAGGTPPYAWSVSQGSLPSWATLNASTGAITGTPNAAGNTPLTFRVTDSNNVTTQSNTLNLVIASAPPPALNITTTSLPSGTVGTAYSATLQASGGTPPYSWSISQGSLPEWATLNPANGAITGTPNASGTTNFTVKVTDSESPVVSVTANMGLTVNPSTNGTPTASNGSVTTNLNTAVSSTLSASDTDGDTLTFAVVSNPAYGVVSITNAATGAFTYTPNTSYTGSDSFTFHATDSAGNVSNTATEIITVGASPIGDVAVNVNNVDLYKLNASDGTVVWGPVNLPNCGGMAVDPTDYSVYVGTTTHCGGSSAAIYKYDSTGAQVWEDTGYAACGTGGAYYIGNGGIAVDENSADPGIVLAMSGFFGNLGKINLAGTATLWCDGTNDLGRPSIVGSTGQIYDVTDAGPSYSYNTIYSATATGSLTSATACEGYTDSNPADGTLYLGGGMASNGCGLKLYQMSTSTLGNINWSVDLSTDVSSFDALALQPWSGGYIYAASASSSKIVVIDPATQSVVTTFSTVVAPNFIAVDPNGGNIYIASSAGDYVYAYSPSGVLVWTSPKLAGTISSLAAARDVVGNP